MTLHEMSKLDGLLIDGGAKARRSTWERDTYVLIKFGTHTVFSFGFLGPNIVTDEDKKATDWELVDRWG